MTENCALNPDGSLKDASEIPWLHSPSQEYSQLPKTSTDGDTSTGGLRPGFSNPRAPTLVALPKVPDLKRKRGEPVESHTNLKGKGLGVARINSLNAGMSGMHEVGRREFSAHLNILNIRNSPN